MQILCRINSRVNEQNIASCEVELNLIDVLKTNYKLSNML